MPSPHFDVLVEPAPGADLAAWRSPVWPVEHPVSVERIKDHRRIYLDYEGQVGGGRGQVERVAGGTCHVDIADAGRWTVTPLTGMAGAISVRPISGSTWELAPV